MPPISKHRGKYQGVLEVVIKLENIRIIAMVSGGISVHIWTRFMHAVIMCVYLAHL